MISLPAVDKEPLLIAHCPTLQQDAQFAYQLVMSSNAPFQLLLHCQALQNEKRLMTQLMKKWPKLLEFAGCNVKADKGIVVDLLRSSGDSFLLSFAAEEVRGDVEVALTAVRLNPGALQFVCGLARYDPEVRQLCGGN